MKSNSAARAPCEDRVEGGPCHTSGRTWSLVHRRHRNEDTVLQRPVNGTAQLILFSRAWLLLLYSTVGWDSKTFIHVYNESTSLQLPAGGVFAPRTISRFSQENWALPSHLWSFQLCFTMFNSQGRVCKEIKPHSISNPGLTLNPNSFPECVARVLGAWGRGCVREKLLHVNVVNRPQPSATVRKCSQPSACPP